jgi:hypothetical protein
MSILTVAEAKIDGIERKAGEGNHVEAFLDVT